MKYALADVEAVNLPRRVVAEGLRKVVLGSGKFILLGVQAQGIIVIAVFEGFKLIIFH